MKTLSCFTDERAIRLEDPLHVMESFIPTLTATQDKRCIRTLSDTQTQRGRSLGGLDFVLCRLKLESPDHSEVLQ